MKPLNQEKFLTIRRTWLILLILLLPLSTVMGGYVGASFVSKELASSQVEQKALAMQNQIQSLPVSYEGLMPMASASITEGIPKVVQKAMPSVVGITSTILQQDWYYGVYEGESVGTGVIVDSRGYILTNSHVVNDGNAKSVKVLLYDGTSKDAKILWNDAILDLAVLKIDGSDLPVASLGNSDEILVGETAVAIGNPLGLTFERSVTSGIISGLERTIPVNDNYNIEGLIQTDASINPGNSGGPLLNISGEVIGINTAKVQSGEGLGFAIPINIAKPIVDEFIQKGEFTKVYLGIKGVNVYQYIRNFGDTLGTDQGVYVYEVLVGSPASLAGLVKDDVITEINGTQINTITKLTRELYKYRPGDEIEMKVVRNGNPTTLKVKLTSE